MQYALLSIVSHHTYTYKIRDLKLKIKKAAKLRNSQVAHTSSLLKYFNKYKKLLSVHKGCKITLRRLQSKITDLEKVVQNIELSNEELLYQTIELADHYLRRSRNCAIGYIDGTMKCRKNYTLTWSVAKPSDEQEKIILFSIVEAKKKCIHSLKNVRRISPKSTINLL